MKAKITGFLLVLLTISGIAANIYAANQSRPVELKADSIEYDSAKGLMTAKGGGVRLTQDNRVITGNYAEYNTKSKEGLVRGNVKAVEADTMITADEVRSYNDNYLIATGEVVLNKGENIVTGPQVEYFSDQQYALASGGVRLDSPDGVITADKMETFFNEDRVIASGKVHIVSEKRNLTADSDQAVYYKGQGRDQGKMVLTGNAKAVQDGNVVVGNILTLYLDQQAMEAQDQSKLVIIPQPKDTRPQSLKPAAKPVN